MEIYIAPIVHTNVFISKQYNLAGGVLIDGRRRGNHAIQLGRLVVVECKNLFRVKD